MLVRLRARGDNALRHGLRGRPSNRKMPEAVKRRAMALFRERKQATLWHDYGPTLGGGRVSRAARGSDEPRDAAEMTDRSQAMAGAASACRISARLAGAAGALWRTAAVGHQ